MRVGQQVVGSVVGLSVQGSGVDANDCVPCARVFLCPRKGVSPEKCSHLGPTSTIEEIGAVSAAATPIASQALNPDFAPDIFDFGWFCEQRQQTAHNFMMAIESETNGTGRTERERRKTEEKGLKEILEYDREY